MAGGFFLLRQFGPVHIKDGYLAPGLCQKIQQPWPRPILMQSACDDGRCRSNCHDMLPHLRRMSPRLGRLTMVKRGALVRQIWQLFQAMKIQRPSETSLSPLAVQPAYAGGSGGVWIHRRRENGLGLEASRATPLPRSCRVEVMQANCHKQPAVFGKWKHRPVPAPIRFPRPATGLVSGAVPAYRQSAHARKGFGGVPLAIRNQSRGQHAATLRPSFQGSHQGEPSNFRHTSRAPCRFDHKPATTSRSFCQSRRLTVRSFYRTTAGANLALTRGGQFVAGPVVSAPSLS